MASFRIYDGLHTSWYRFIQAEEVVRSYILPDFANNFFHALHKSKRVSCYTKLSKIGAILKKREKIKTLSTISAS